MNIVISNKKEAHLAIVRIKDLEWLIENVFDQYPSFLTEWQLKRYQELRLGITKKIKRLEDLESHLVNSDRIYSNINNSSMAENIFIDNWIVGFLNGEVSFTHFTQKKKQIPSISLEHTDKPALELIKNRLNINPKIFSRTRGNRKTTYILNITR